MGFRAGLRTRLRHLRPDRVWSRIRKRLARGPLASVYPQYDADELTEALRSVGVTPGRTVFLHSAWDEFYNFQGSPTDFIRILLDTLGPEGTLAMPAFPASMDPTVIFSVERAPTAAGLLPEVFRRWPGVRRSINLFHSVSAIGPQAEYLTQDHHRSLTAWDEHSPYYRLGELDALVLAAGLPRSFGLGTVIHCAESILRTEDPFLEGVFGAPVTYRYRDADGREGEHTMLVRNGPNAVGWRPNRILKHIAPDRIAVARLSNLRLQSIGARYLIDRLVELGRQGITTYPGSRRRRP